MHIHHQNLAGDAGRAGRLQAKVDMPKVFAGSRLDGVKVDSWIFSINLYFTALDVPEQQQAMCVAFNLSEEAAV